MMVGTARNRPVPLTIVEDAAIMRVQLAGVVELADTPA